MISRRDAWTPPARPDWVMRINAEGDALDIASVVPLDPQSLIAAAVGNTGLSDFGSDDWRAPFAALLKSFNEESGLNLMGRIMTRSDLLMFLEGRLRVEQLYKDHPEIEDEVIDRPMWILGQGRTGTSILQKLLGLDPANRGHITYEQLFPVAEPHPAGTPDPRIARAEGRMRMWSRVTPEVDTIHDFAALEPMETIMAECMSFQTPAWFNVFGMVPTYTAMMAAQGPQNSLGYYKRILKAAQFQRPGGQWILKSPDAIRYMPTVLRLFPDVRFVWAHRDPVRALASAVNMIGTLVFVRSDRRVAADVFDFITDPGPSARDLSKPIDWIEDGTLPAAQLYNIHYDALIADPLAEIARLYGHFGMQLSEAARTAINTYLAANPREERPAHRYDTGEAEQIADERKLYARYQKFFGVKREL